MEFAGSGESVLDFLAVDGVGCRVQCREALLHSRAGTGERSSLSQYLARELSRRINRERDRFPVEGSLAEP